MQENVLLIHGADYVSDSFIQNNKRLGRSLGCPAIPLALTDKIISVIKINHVYLFIIHQVIKNFRVDNYFNV
jgi:hypothetical protein